MGIITLIRKSSSSLFSFCNKSTFLWSAASTGGRATKAYTVPNAMGLNTTDDARIGNDESS